MSKVRNGEVSEVGHNMKEYGTYNWQIFLGKKRKTNSCDSIVKLE